MKEGGTVNRSLLALGNCITVLSEGKAGSFVPYRDSKLTRLLKDSLGGNSKTCMITTISTSARDYEETMGSLKYAYRAKAIKNHALKNVTDSSENAANEMSSIVEALKKENEALKKMVSDANIGSAAPKKLAKPGAGGPLAELERKIKDHFQVEKQIRQRRAEAEVAAASLAEEMDQDRGGTSEPQLGKLHQLGLEKARLGEDLGVMMKERLKLIEEVNDSGLNNVQITFLSNIIHKEQLEAVPTLHEA